MIIVSRDKTVILNFNNTTNVRICEEDLKTIIANDNSNKTYILGSYNTKERAKEVLQEIVNYYRKEIEIVYSGSYDYHPVNSIICRVYEMPEE